MDERETPAYLLSASSSYGISLTVETLASFNRFSLLLAEGNIESNLVSSRDMERLVTYHYLDSLKTACCIDYRHVHRLMDFGSGAGFPGIPLAIAFPHIETVFVDSRKKRCEFLRYALSQLEILQTTVIMSRAEVLPLAFDGTFDAVVTRASSSLSDFYRVCNRFICRGGVLVSIKGDRIDAELRDLMVNIDTCSFSLQTVIPPFVDGVRSGTVVVVTRL